MAEKRPKILVVDDIPSNVHVLSRILKDDYDIYFATDGERALELVQSRMPDLVLLDIMMPGMDGFEVCTRIKADTTTRDIPVIFISAKSEVEDETRGLEVGAIDFITKPISPPIVKARVRNHLLLKRQADLLRSLSFLDGLTGIANRRQFDETMQREWRRCARMHAPLSLIMLDVDHFKAFNDHYGHQAGDECLRAVAEVLAEQVKRPSDLVARYGGEEFVCLLPETENEGAILVAERLRDAVARLGIPHASSPVAPHVTISLGVATALPTSDTSPESLSQLADQLLYQAKRSGRNRAEGAVVPAL
ncbi:diguanylate cyclase [Azospirillum thermophilum]|uniref:Diguanylate cyclase response regulator n=1 Tax=Azospirillum thermophilum TaxID=2202148 RepID=A0A2S2CU78_9PROT|nr:PleD family two-component system response regulator [Azospirillum thermophilum]AWK88062.1 diguanylate cyclase response regulator [Azospirillum thermophilum]